jgi:hypothetical protein
MIVPEVFEERVVRTRNVRRGHAGRGRASARFHGEKRAPFERSSVRANTLR